MNWITHGKRFEVKPSDFDDLNFQCLPLIKISKNHYMETTLFELIFG